MKIQNTWQILFPAFENDVSLDKREFLKWSPIFLKNICQQLTLRISNKKKIYKQWPCYNATDLYNSEEMLTSSIQALVSSY